MRLGNVARLLLLVAALPVTAAGQEAAPGCWIRGDRAGLELRASPYDSAAVALAGGTAKICYSQPRMLGRRIMGGLVPYGEAWRFGANEATALHVPVRATIAGVAVGPGWYSLMAVPGEQEWRIIVNREANRWGVPITETVRSADVGSGVVPAEEEVGSVELFTLDFVRTGPSSADLVAAWDRTRVRIPIVLLADPAARPR